MTAFSLCVPPAAEPVTLAEAKAHLRLTTSDDDALIATLITAARQWAEAHTGRALMTQTWRLALDLPAQGLADIGIVRLPRAPLQSVTEIQSFDDADTATPWPSRAYFVDTVAEPGRVVLRTTATPPLPTRRSNAIVVTYVAGYGDTAADVPAGFRAAILQCVAHWYDHRATADGKDASVPLAVRALLAPYRLRYTEV